MAHCLFLINYLNVPFVEAAAVICFGLFLQVTMKQRIYHGSFYKNADGTNKIIKAGEKYSVPTEESFWKDPCDVKNGLKTTSREKNEPVVQLKDFNRYLNEKRVDFWINK